MADDVGFWSEDPYAVVFGTDPFPVLGYENMSVNPWANVLSAGKTMPDTQGFQNYIRHGIPDNLQGIVNFRPGRTIGNEGMTFEQGDWEIDWSKLPAGSTSYGTNITHAFPDEAALNEYLANPQEYMADIARANNGTVPPGFTPQYDPNYGWVVHRGAVESAATQRYNNSTSARISNFAVNVALPAIASATMGGLGFPTAAMGAINTARAVGNGASPLQIAASVGGSMLGSYLGGELGSMTGTTEIGPFSVNLGQAAGRAIGSAAGSYGRSLLGGGGATPTPTRAVTPSVTTNRQATTIPRTGSSGSMGTMPTTYDNATGAPVAVDFSPAAPWDSGNTGDYWNMGTGFDPNTWDNGYGGGAYEGSNGATGTGGGYSGSIDNYPTNWEDYLPPGNGGGGWGGLGDLFGGMGTGSYNALGLGLAGVMLPMALKQFYDSGQWQDMGETAAQMADPFGPYRQQYATQLSDVYANPQAYLDNPSHRATVEKQLNRIQSRNRATGYMGSGKDMIDMADYQAQADAQYLDAEKARLAQLAGSQFNPAGASEYYMRGGTNAINSQNLALGTLGQMFTGLMAGNRVDQMNRPQPINITNNVQGGAGGSGGAGGQGTGGAGGYGSGAGGIPSAAQLLQSPALQQLVRNLPASVTASLGSNPSPEAVLGTVMNYGGQGGIYDPNTGTYNQNFLNQNPWGYPNNSTNEIMNGSGPGLGGQTPESFMAAPINSGLSTLYPNNFQNFSIDNTVMPDMSWDSGNTGDFWDLGQTDLGNFDLGAYF